MVKNWKQTDILDLYFWGLLLDKELDWERISARKSSSLLQ